MPSQRKIEEYLSELEDLQEKVRNDDELSEKLVHARKAAKVYSAFRARYKEDDFEMHVLETSKGGKKKEKPFDWESLD